MSPWVTGHKPQIISIIFQEKYKASLRRQYHMKRQRHTQIDIKAEREEDRERERETYIMKIDQPTHRRYRDNGVDV